MVDRPESYHEPAVDGQNKENNRSLGRVGLPLLGAAFEDHHHMLADT